MMAYILIRNISSTTGACVTLPMGLYQEKEAAEKVARDMTEMVNKSTELKFENLDQTVKDLLGSMGIMNVSHAVMGPFEILGTEKPLILDPKDWNG